MMLSQSSGLFPSMFSEFKMAILVFGLFSLFTLGIGAEVLVDDDDPLIDPYNVREEGCPIVSERNRLDISKVLEK